MPPPKPVDDLAPSNCTEGFGRQTAKGKLVKKGTVGGPRAWSQPRSKGRKELRTKRALDPHFSNEGESKVDVHTHNDSPMPSSVHTRPVAGTPKSAKAASILVSSTAGGSGGEIPYQSGEGIVGAEDTVGPSTNAASNDVCLKALKNSLLKQMAGSASGDLSMPDNPESIPTANMMEDVLEDTLKDLRRMSPESTAPKVNPFIGVPRHKLTSADRLANKEQHDIFLECSTLSRDEQGCLTKKA